MNDRREPPEREALEVAREALAAVRSLSAPEHDLATDPETVRCIWEASRLGLKRIDKIMGEGDATS